MLSTLQVLKDRAANVALKTFADSPAINGSWHVHLEELSRVNIKWPATYQWESAGIWVDGLTREFRRRVKVDFVELTQPYRGIVIFQFANERGTHDVAIDYSDYPEINSECASRCSLYFKMQHRREGYGYANVVPGGYVCDSRKIYLHLPRLRRLRDQQDFAFDVYGRFSTEFARDIRKRAIGILSNQTRFRFEGGLRKVKLLDFLREVARARICIDLPGEGDLCFRLINYLAVGACIVGPRPRTTLHVPLQDRIHVAYVRDDLSDLVETCRYYLENDEAREEMRVRSREFFDRYLHNDNLAAYYLRTCLDRLSN